MLWGSNSLSEVPWYLMLKDDKNFECCPLAEVHLYKDKKTADKGSGKLQVKQVWAQ